MENHKMTNEEKEACRELIRVAHDSLNISEEYLKLKDEIETGGSNDKLKKDLLKRMEWINGFKLEEIQEERKNLNKIESELNID